MVINDAADVCCLPVPSDGAERRFRVSPSDGAFRRGRPLVPIDAERHCCASLPERLERYSCPGDHWRLLRRQMPMVCLVDRACGRGPSDEAERGCRVMVLSELTTAMCPTDAKRHCGSTLPERLKRNSFHDGHWRHLRRQVPLVCIIDLTHSRRAERWTYA
jgi:hypothetical protein